MFQKKGPGPQNGAQYGAPLVEEEWEREEEEGVIEQDDGEICYNVITDDPLLTEMDELDKVGEWEKVLLFYSDFTLMEELKLILVSISKDWSTEGQIVLPDLSSQIKIGDVLDDNENDTKDLSQWSSLLRDEFLELNDFAWFPVEPAIHQEEAPAAISESNIFNPVEEEPDFSECLFVDQSPDRNSFLEVNDILGCEPIQQNAQTSVDVNTYEDSSFFDAYNIPLHDSLPSSSDEPDLVDELLAYFDATENAVFDLGSADLNAHWVSSPPLERCCQIHEDEFQKSIILFLNTGE